VTPVTAVISAKAKSSAKISPINDLSFETNPDTEPDP